MKIQCLFQQKTLLTIQFNPVQGETKHPILCVSTKCIGRVILKRQSTKRIQERGNLFSNYHKAIDLHEQML